MNRLTHRCALPVLAGCRVPDPQGLEGVAPVPEHPPQPRPLPLPGQVRPLPIRGQSLSLLLLRHLCHVRQVLSLLRIEWLASVSGCSQAQHVHAVRQRDPLVPGERARQAGDARALPPPRHQIQVVHLQVRERRAVRPLRAAAQRPAHDLRSQGLIEEPLHGHGWWYMLALHY
jgi:hypothetical protein